MDIGRLRAANPGLEIFGPGEEPFAAYGRPLALRGIGALLAAADGLVPRGLEANRYQASEPALESLPAARELEAAFGLSPVQVGWCSGPNSRLNGLEWHKSPEVVVALSDLALLVGLRKDIAAWSSYDASLLGCLFLRRGEAVELDPGVLHLSACRVEEGGFRNLCVLPRGTNAALSEAELAAARAAGGEARLLFMRNKWILAHPERAVLVERGAWPGIAGENIEIKY